MTWEEMFWQSLFSVTFLLPSVHFCLPPSMFMFITGVLFCVWSQDGVDSVVIRLWAGGCGPLIPLEQSFFLSPKLLRRASYSVVTGGEAAGALKLVNDLHLLLWIRMSGAMPPLPTYSFMVCTGTTVPLFILCLLLFIFSEQGHLPWADFCLFHVTFWIVYGCL